MAQSRLILAVGQEKPNGPYGVLYIGDDADKGLAVLQSAGLSRKIASGGLIRNPEFELRRDFTHIPTAEERAAAEKAAAERAEMERLTTEQLAQDAADASRLEAAAAAAIAAEKLKIEKERLKLKNNDK